MKDDGAGIKEGLRDVERMVVELWSLQTKG